jgi:hypothetical protein
MPVMADGHGLTDGSRRRGLILLLSGIPTSPGSIIKYYLAVDMAFKEKESR